MYVLQGPHSTQAFKLQLDCASEEFDLLLMADADAGGNADNGGGNGHPVCAVLAPAPAFSPPPALSGIEPGEQPRPAFEAQGGGEGGQGEGHSSAEAGGENNFPGGPEPSPLENSPPQKLCQKIPRKLTLKIFFLTGKWLRWVTGQMGTKVGEKEKHPTPPALALCLGGH